MSQISRVTSGNKYIEKAEEIASRSSPLRLLNSNSEDIYTQILYLLSVEKASVPDSAANAASTTSSSTPRESRPITTLFLLTAVFSVPSFHHCVTVHYHHHPIERHHHRCQPFGAFYDDSFFLFPPFSLSLLSYFCLQFLSQWISINNNNNNNARCCTQREMVTGAASKSYHAVQGFYYIGIR